MWRMQRSVPVQDEQRPRGGARHPRLPASGVPLRRLGEPETSGVERLQPFRVEQDRVEVVGDGVAVLRAGDVSEAWQALAVRGQVAAL